MVTYTIKKVGTLKYTRLNAISIFKIHSYQFGNSYSYAEAKEIIDLILNNTYDEVFNDKDKYSLDFIFDGMEYMEHGSDEPESYIYEINFPCEEKSNNFPVEFLKELYEMGFNDGYERCGDVECSLGGDVMGYDKVIDVLYKKYGL
jgi:hypothetical protein